MKKNLCFALVLLLGITISQAQIAQWKMLPKYDNMYIPEGTNLIVTDSLGLSTDLWDFEGKHIAQLDGEMQMHAFHNGVAVTTDHDNTSFRGFMLTTGEYISLQSGGYSVARSYPYLSDGYLLVQEPATKFYRYVNKSGHFSDTPYINAYPFFNGYSACKYYENPERMKNLIPCLLNTELQPVRFTFLDKPIKESSLDFVSSVNDDGIAIVVARRKVYLFHSKSHELRPLCSTMDADNLKEQARIPGDLAECLVHDNDTTWSIKATCGKGVFVWLYFDKFMKPISIHYTNQEKVFDNHITNHSPLPSPLRITSDKGKLGLLWEDREVLAPQFESIPTCFGDKAIVRKNGKYGMVQIFSDKQFQVSIHKKGERIPFIHKRFATNIRVDLPPFIMAEKVSIDVIDTSSGCLIDKTSIERKNTEDGNYLQYNCNLRIPNVLFDQDESTIQYPVQITYDGFVSPRILVEVKVWLCKNISVVPDYQSRILNDGSLSFDFSLNYAYPNDKNEIYHVKVSAQPDSSCQLQEFSATRYKCTVPTLQEGANKINIIVTEEGFPPISFPFEIVYTKKTAPTIEEPEGKEEEVTLKVQESKPVRKKGPIVPM